MDQRQGPRIAVRRVLEKEHWCTAMRCIPSTSEEGEDCDHLSIQNTSALGRPLEWSTRLQRRRSEVYTWP